MKPEESKKTITQIIIDIVKKRWKIILPVVLVVLTLIGYYFYNSNQVALENEARVKALASKSSTPEGEGKDTPEGLDTMLMDQQGELNEKYGKPKKGFIWDIDGTPLSLGNKGMNAEDVVYTFLRGLSTLDFSTAEFNSRRSSVVQSYNDFFDNDSSSSIDYKDKFNRNMYKQSLLSLQVQSVTRSANFSTNKQVFTVKAKMLDLSNKEFWTTDKQEVFNKITSFRKSEEDPTKADIYLYDYVSSAYEQSVSALSSSRKTDTTKLPPMKDITFDLTVQKYPAQDSGYLVSIDKDLDLLCKYSEGTNIVDYIKTLYQDSLY